MPPDRGRRGFARRRLDEPGVDQDEAVEPGLGPEQGDRRRPVAQAEAVDALDRRAFGAKASRRRRKVGTAAAKARIVAAAVADASPVEAKARNPLFRQGSRQPFVYPVRAHAGLAAAGDEE